MLISKFKQSLSNKFIRNAGALGAAELANRIFRLGTTITLARMFSPQDYGLMAVVYTVFDFATVFTFRGGIGAKIVQADEQDVKTICDTSYWLNWILCIAIFLLQCIAAFPIAQFYKNQQLVLPICTVGLVYLMFPLFLVNSAIIERENRLKITALCNVIQSLLSNIIIVVFALMGMGVWAIVWSMVLTTPVWIIITWRNHSWRPPKLFKLDKYKEVISFGADLLAIELLGKLRGNIDYLIIGGFLSIEALGIYYFAFNAGLGISMSVINTFGSALFPYLCEVRSNLSHLKERYFSSLKKAYFVITPLILLQTCLAPIYVPIIFGQKWSSAIPVLMLICLSALSLQFGRATFLLLNAMGKTRLTLYWNLIYTILFSTGLLISVHGGIIYVAIAVVICQLFIAPIFNIWVVNRTFYKKQFITL
ncbi:Polysaccharide biosynthesis protein [Trichormus variabilis ATCC 29413]|uniref:Polysaccharide biosynthesis protein n=4 Tax=Anabaena variabilis TaxID=264691 RepID=Q3MEW6_TRIV2|nr:MULTISPECIES: lipopolysaccharide biosynthesis protein [Nostocaceae]ABA20470.1 Polysaccharide biosynthesis protein [Trichormus variabilis ATCC 29413]MBC1215805.1 lipopolysaccharide biosynthesis protein [Trichormus variabilis ARAD]MBC1267983.1 lipopolysaccharide biosynthesis protein [Trichormus variabilis FSR]MBC1304379.1 lipopolysaccharide biosynthesis protein [Trichormus variabilis N2B]MBC1312865.1 lipopolysaccharide biosynthesis protein [Trichormus variabilis PNB]